jgi:hypothetical protein
MSPLTTVIAAFALALVAMSFAFAGGAVIVAVPLALVVVGVVAFIDLNRRRTQMRNIHRHRDEARTDRVEFTERDHQTLTSD